MNLYASRTRFLTLVLLAILAGNRRLDAIPAASLVLPERELENARDLLAPAPALAQLKQNGNRSIAALRQAAFLLAGTSEQRQAQATEKLDTLLQKAVLLSTAFSSQYELGEALMDLLHSEVLKVYNEQTTTLDAALLEGRYNCVSSSLLFFLMATRCGLDVQAVVTTDHSFCLVRLDDGRPIDAETTNHFGWDPGTRKEFQDSKNQSAGFRYVPPGNYSLRRQIDGPALVALIGQNMATLQERQGKLREAVKTMANTVFWSEDPVMAEALAGRVNNTAGQLAQRGEWLSALALLEVYENSFGLDARLAELLRSIRRGWLGTLARDQELETMVSLLRDTVQLQWLDESDTSELLHYVYGKAVETASRQNRWLEAWELTIQGRIEWPGQARLQELEEQAKTNWTYSIHNEFARLFNARRFGEARTLLEGALRKLPDQPLLLENLALLDQASQP